MVALPLKGGTFAVLMEIRSEAFDDIDRRLDFPETTYGTRLAIRRT
jgi:hypothetical protein